jgi:hypothetical protein
MAVDSKQSSHSLKSPQVAKQPDNLIKKRAEITKNYIPQEPSQRSNGTSFLSSQKSKGALLRIELIHHL